MNKTSRPLWLAFFIFLLPLTVSNVLQSLSATLNNVFLGKLIGVNALAAASIFFPLNFLFIAFVVGVSSGGSVLIGQAYGAGRIDKMKAITGTVLSVTAISGSALCLLAILFTPAIMRGLGAPPEIFDDAVRFARYSFFSLPVILPFFMYTGMLRGVGDSLTPLAGMAFATLLCAALTPALILGWWGLPKLGIVAPAIGNLVAFALATIGLALYLRWRKHPLGPDRALMRSLKPDFELLPTILRIGAPTGAQMMAGAVAGLVIVGLVNQFGPSATAAYGAVNQVMSYVQYPAVSVGIAASIFGAQTIGAGRADRLGAVTRTALAMNFLLTGLLVLLIYWEAEPVLRLFLDDPEVVALGKRLLHIVAWSALMFGSAQVMAGVMRASGDALIPMLLALAAIFLIEIPVAVLLSRSMGMPGIWWGFVAAFGSMMLLQAGYYWFFWRKKTVVALI